MTQRIRKPHRHFILAVLASTPLVGLLASSALAASPVEKLQEFPLDQVQITDEYQKGLFAKEMTYLLDTLDADKLLVGFKAMSSGNNNPSGLYPGWEARLIRGHTMGHWLSAVAHAYGQTKGNDEALNTKIKTKLDHVITMLKTYQRPDGFLFATTDAQFGAPEGKGGDSWVPWYTMHKILAGLVDVVKYTGSTDALDVASKLGDWIYARGSGWDAGTNSRVLGMEYGGMNDALYELYKVTTKANHLTAAHFFDETNLFTTTASGNDTLNNRHANTTIPKFIGALNRFRTLGTAEQAYFTAADKFLEIVLKSHTYITGGNSEAEFFHEPGKLDVRRTALNNETCNSYNMSKLTQYLFLATGDIKYADYYERVHINEILASINPESAMTTYFKAMGTGFFKVFSSPDRHFWCCTGTGMENFTRLNDSVYFHDAKDLWLTYYVSSTLDWKERGLALTQTTDLPLSNKVSITVTAAPTDAVALKFRKPNWAANCDVGITVNGQAASATEASGFYSVSRVWQANDKIELTFPLFVQVSRLQDNQNAVAFTYGPIVLSASLGIDNNMNTQPQGIEVLQATKPAGIQEGFAINSSTTINAWLSDIQKNLVQTPGKLEFNLKNTDSDGKLVFTPHYARYKDRYGIYWKLTGGAGGTFTSTVTCPTVPTGGTGGGSGAGGSSGTGGKSGTGGAGGGAPASTGGTTSASGGGVAGATANGGSTLAGGSAAGNTSTSGGGKTSASGGSSGGGNSKTGTAVASSAGGGNSGSNSGAAGSSGTSSDTASHEKSGGGCALGGQAQTTGPITLGLLLGLALLARRRQRNRRV